MCLNLHCSVCFVPTNYLCEICCLDLQQTWVAAPHRSLWLCLAGSTLTACRCSPLLTCVTDGCMNEWEITSGCVYDTVTCRLGISDFCSRSSPLHLFDCRNSIPTSWLCSWRPPCRFVVPHLCGTPGWTVLHVCMCFKCYASSLFQLLQYHRFHHLCGLFQSFYHTWTLMNYLKVKG